MISLVAFLGNHGKTYRHNRHNVAWLFADSLSLAASLSWQSKFKGRYASCSIAPLDGGPRRVVHFLKPETFMNLSGESVAEAAAFYRIPPADILVVHDELELPPGTVSLKWSGGLGGHNGLRSLKASLGTADFWRLRFGIGRPVHGDVASFVLSDFTGDEQILMSQVWSLSEDLFTRILGSEPQQLLPEWAKKRLVEP